MNAFRSLFFLFVFALGFFPFPVGIGSAVAKEAGVPSVGVRLGKGAGGGPVPCYPGEIWFAHETNRIWTAVAANETGSFLAATASGDFVYTSTDHGVTWTPQSGSGSRPWWAVAMSATGQHLLAAANAGQLHVSHDFGVTWIPTESVRTWNTVASSANGVRMGAAADNGFLYTSDDSGATWTPRVFAPHWRSVALSGSGQVQVAADIGGFVHLSTDAGVTWSAQTALGTGDWHTVACSSNGQHLAAVAFNGILYLSHDSGSTWVQGQPFNSWHALSMSADGSQIVAAAFNGRIHVSNDFGATWYQTESTRNWHGLAMSGDGTLILAADYGGQLHVSECARALEVVCPRDFEAECGAAWKFGVPTGTSTCGGTVSVVESGTVTNGTCPMVLTRTWTVSDACGNTNLCQQSVTIRSSRPPVFEGTAHKEVPCGTAWTFDPPSAVSACDGVRLAIRTVGTTTNGICPATYTRTWEAVDACGNAATFQQTVQVVDTTPPTVECGPERLEVALGADCRLRIPEIRVRAKDDCTPPGRLRIEQDPPAGTWVDGPCQNVVIRVADLCGNLSHCEVRVCGTDRTPPRLECPKEAVAVDCRVPDVIRGLVATDDCTASRDLVWTQEPPAGSPAGPGVDRVVIRVTDAAGNSAVCEVPLSGGGSRSFLDRLFNTGVDAARQSLAVPAVDPHFTLESVPPGTSTAPGFHHPPDAVAVGQPWGIPASSVSRWIRPGVQGAPYPTGEFVYTFRFVLPAGVDPASAFVAGRWAADDRARMFLNGFNHTDFKAAISVPPPAGYTGWHPFSVQGGFLAAPATNSLHLVVENIDLLAGYTGVRLEFQQATAGCAECVPPAVVLSPRSLIRPQLGSATMSVVASGSPALTYQWYRNGTPLADGGPISGATSATLTVSPLQFAHAGQYSVLVSNDCGRIRSRSAALRVHRGFTWNWGWWWGAGHGHFPGAVFGPELGGSDASGPGFGAGFSGEFGLPPLHGQPIPVVQPPLGEGFAGWRLPVEVVSPAGTSNPGWTLLFDLHARTSSVPDASRILARWPADTGSSAPATTLSLGGDRRLRLVRSGAAGPAMDLLPPLSLGETDWSRIGVVWNPGSSDGIGPVLTLHLDGRPVGEVELEPASAGAFGEGCRLFPGGSGEGMEVFVGSLQFHRVDLGSAWMTALGGPDAGELDGVDPNPALESVPRLRVSWQDGVPALDWSGTGVRLQETTDLSGGLWMDSERNFDQVEEAMGIRTSVGIRSSAEVSGRFFRLVRSR